MSVHWKVFTSNFFDERGAQSCCPLIFQSLPLCFKVILLVPIKSVGPSLKGRSDESDWFAIPSSAIMLSAFMRKPIFILVALLFVLESWAQSSKELAKVVGSWEGDSKCSVPNSPCHDEHVLYQISVDRKDPDHLSLDAYKIVEGSPDFMGTLACSYHAKQGSLSCTGNTSQQDDWEFHIFGDSMSGRLTIEGGKLYRVIALRRAKDK